MAPGSVRRRIFAGLRISVQTAACVPSSPRDASISALWLRSNYAVETSRHPAPSPDTPSSAAITRRSEINAIWNWFLPSGTCCTDRRSGNHQQHADLRRSVISRWVADGGYVAQDRRKFSSGSTASGSIGFAPPLQMLYRRRQRNRQIGHPALALRPLCHDQF